MSTRTSGERRLRILIAYYSRGGHTRRAAQDLAEALSGQHDVTMVELKPSHPLGPISGLLLTRRRHPAEIEPLIGADAFDLVYLGAPIWAGQMHAVAWGYLAARLAAVPHVLFATSGGGDNEAGGMRLLGQALMASGCAVAAAVDMRYPGTASAKIPALASVAQRLSES